MTSPIKTIDVLCPQCGHLYEDWHRGSVNLDLDDFHDEYLEECSTAVCPECKFKVHFGSLTVEDGVFHLKSSNHIDSVDD